MKSQLRTLAVAISMLCAATSFAQIAAPATKASAPSAASATPASKAPTMAKTGSAQANKAAVPTVAAAGGGDGKVWVNTKSKTYHCENTKYYGKTKVGEYMTEADAKTKGNHADHGKVCAK